MLDYGGSTAGVALSLVTGMGSGGHAWDDRVSGFEDVIGSRHHDQITGSGGANRIIGGGGAERRWQAVFGLFVRRSYPGALTFLVADSALKP